MNATINIFSYKNSNGDYEASSPQILSMYPTTGRTEKEAIDQLVGSIASFFLDRRNTAIETFNQTQDFYTVTSIPVTIYPEMATTSFSEEAIDVTRKLALVGEWAKGARIPDLISKSTRPCEKQFLQTLEGKDPIQVAFDLGKRMDKILNK